MMVIIMMAMYIVCLSASHSNGTPVVLNVLEDFEFVIISNCDILMILEKMTMIYKTISP